MFTVLSSLLPDRDFEAYCFSTGFRYFNKISGEPFRIALRVLTNATPCRASSSFYSSAARQGFEPQFLVPETNVLPLDDRARSV